MHKDQIRDQMQDFAIKIAREVAVRGFGHKPDNEQEKKWAKDGPVKPHLLDTIQVYCP